MDPARINLLYEKAKDIEQWGRAMGFGTDAHIYVHINEHAEDARLEFQMWVKPEPALTRYSECVKALERDE